MSRQRSLSAGLALLAGAAGCDAILGLSEPIDGGGYGDGAASIDGPGRTDSTVAGDAQGGGDGATVDALAPVDSTASADTLPTTDGMTMPVDSPAGDGFVGPGGDGGDASPGTPTLFVAMTGITSVAVNGGTVAWTTGDSVYECPTAGCPAPSKLLGQRKAPGQVGLDGAYVYWTEPTGMASGGPFYCPKAGCVGGTPTQPATGGAAGPLSVNNGTVAWTDTSNAYSCGTGCPSPLSLATTGSPPATTIRADGTAVVWANGTTIRPVTAIGVDGGSGHVGTAFLANAVALEVIGGFVYWTGPSGVMDCQIGHCVTPPPELLAGPPDAGWTPSAIAADKLADGGSHLYWSGVGSIQYCLRDQCDASTFASTTLPSVPSIAVSTDTSMGVVTVYWVDQAGIMEVQLP